MKVYSMENTLRTSVIRIYPDLPEDFYGIIARYTWGAPFTKKEIKQTTKKIKKKKKEVPQGFSMVRGKFELDFN